MSNYKASNYKKPAAKGGFTPHGINVDAFEKQKTREDCMAVAGEFFYTRIGNPITQLNTREGLIDVDPHFVATVALSPASAEYLAKQGFDVREPNQSINKPHVKFRRNVKGADTNVDFFDADGREYDKSVLIGNGSKGQALVFVYPGKEGGKKGALLGVQLSELVEYNPPKTSPEEKASYAKAPAAPATRKRQSYEKSEIQEEDAAHEDKLPW